MKIYFKIIFIALFAHIAALNGEAFDIFKEYQKVIWINQPKQVGIAYQ
jgi:hypothetical protein